MVKETKAHLSSLYRSGSTNVFFKVNILGLCFFPVQLTLSCSMKANDGMQMNRCGCVRAVGTVGTV